MNTESDGLELFEKLRSFVDSSQSYQHSLNVLLQLVEWKSAAKNQRQKQLETTLSQIHDIRSGDLPVSMELYRTPYFQTASRTAVPAYHAEVEVAVFLNSEEPTALRSNTYWSSQAQNTLINAVHSKKKDMLTRDYNYERKKLERANAMLQKELEQTYSSAEINNMAGWEHKCQIDRDIARNQGKMADFDIAIARLPSLPLSAKLFREVEMPPHEWYYISTGHRKLQKHTPEACQLKYQFALDPFLKEGPWDSEEKMKLRQLVEKYGSRNWDAIAFEIKGRTAFQCCRAYLQSQQEQKQSDRSNTLRFSAGDIVLLIHTYVVGSGNWSLIGRMFSHRHIADIKRYWTRHLNPDVSRSSWTKKDWEKIRKFASDHQPDQGLERLYAKFPERLAWTVKKYFLELYANSGDHWEEKDPAIPFPTGQGYEKQVIVVKKLYEHIIETVTKPVRENSSLSLADLLKSEKIVGPVRNFMTDLQLYPEIPNAAESLDAVVQTLSPADRKLIELFGAPTLDACFRRGRKKHVNCFSDIPVPLQPKTSGERLEIVSAGFMAEHEDSRGAPALCLPPSLPILNGLLKLKQLCLHTPLPTQEVLSLCDPYDLRAMVRRAVSVFVTSELALINADQFRTPPPDDVDIPQNEEPSDFPETALTEPLRETTLESSEEVDLASLTGPLTAQKLPKKEIRRRPGRKVNTKRNILKKVKWLAESENRKKLNMMLKKVVREEKKAAGEFIPRKKRFSDAALPEPEKRRSSRLTDKDVTSAPDNNLFLPVSEGSEAFEELSPQPSTSQLQDISEFDLSVLDLVPTSYSLDPLNNVPGESSSLLPL